ncbi:polyprotein-like, partial [Trifolium medium]|nr:polyprotein-like [Trifolium medium]
MQEDEDYTIKPKKKKNGMCKPSPPPQRRSDPDNGPWIGIHKKAPPLPIYEEALRILREENLIPPDDPDLVTWSPTDSFQSNHEPIPYFMYSSLSS